MGAILISLIVWFVGCAPTQQARKFEKFGFLGDYSRLREGEKGEALLIYRNPNDNWPAYDNVLFESVTIWHGKGSNLNDVPEADLQRLANYLHTIIVNKLGEDYEIVDKPGTGVLHIRAAITEVVEPKVGLDIFSTIVPQARILSGAKQLATGTNSFVGRASIEEEITDAETILYFLVPNQSVPINTTEKSCKGLYKTLDTFFTTHKKGDFNKVVNHKCQWCEYETICQ